MLGLPRAFPTLLIATVALHVIGLAWADSEGQRPRTRRPCGGLGIANAPLWQIRSLVDRGDVELILTRFEAPPIPIHAVWPATRMLPARTQLFVEFLAMHLRNEPL
jgi:hypothetical protein